MQKFTEMKERIEIIGQIEGVKTLSIGVARCTIDLFDIKDAMILLGLTQQNVKLTVEPMEQPEKGPQSGTEKKKTRRAGSKRSKG